MSEVEFDPIGTELVNIERAWHPVAKNAGQEYGVVDIDVSPDFENPYEFSDPGEVQTALVRLAIEAEKEDSGQNIDFIREKIRAHLMYIRVTSGDEVGLDEHVEAAMGTRPEMVDEDILDAHRGALDAQLRAAKAGIPLRFDGEHRKDLKNELIISDAAAVRRELIISNDHSSGFILRRTGIEPVYIEPEIVEEDAEWSGYLGTEGKEFFYKVNVHPRHEYTIGRIWGNPPHERTHIAQYGNVFKNSVKRGELSVATGVTCFHTLENTQAEFNAQAVEQMALRELGFSAREDSWRFAFEADYNYYAEMVWNNAHIMINSGADEEEVVKYAEDRLLLDTHENIASTTRARRDDPIYRSYFGGAYWPSLLVGMEMIKPGHLTEPEGEQPAPEDFLNLQKSIFSTTMSRPIRLDEIKSRIGSGT